MNIRNRIEKLEQQCDSDDEANCVIAVNFGAESEEEQLAKWKLKNPGVEPIIMRIELVSL